MRKPETAPPARIRVEATPERIARGKYLFENVADCHGCHSPRDPAKFTLPELPGQLGAGFVFPAELGLPGRIVAPNLTSDPETGLGRWSDGEIIRAVREGVSRDGRALFNFMPYESFARMSDSDVQALVAYMRTLPPVKSALPRTELDLPVRLLMAGVPKPVRGPVSAPDPGDRVKHGEYLAAMAGCAHCHTRMERGKPMEGMELAGGQPFQVGRFLVHSANITPDEETGTGRWSEERFLSKFKGYRNMTYASLPRNTQANFTLMPWLGYSKLTDEDLRAIYAYLRTVKPVYQPVDVHPDLAETN